MPRSNPLMLACGLVAVAAVLLAGMPGCDAPSAREDDKQDLRDWALDESVPRDERVDVLMRMLRNEQEDPDVRATAAQMLGRLQVPAAIPLLLETLGGGNAVRAEESEILRMEAVIALGRFADAGLYQTTFQLMYVKRREPSQLVRRMFVQSFENVSLDRVVSRPSDELTPEERSEIRALAPFADVLRDVMVTARDASEDRGIVWRALHELRRIGNRPDLDVSDDAEWKRVIEDLRAGEREPDPVTAPEVE